MTSAFDFTVTGGDGAPHPLDQYRGRVLLIVNTASRCGFTPQYAGLEALWRQYREQGLTVIGFPCNQFGEQEPGSAEEIASFCALTYDVDFPLMAKIEVNGGNAEPFYEWLKRQAPGLLGSKGIKWNFTKFLVGRDGQVIDRYAPTTKPEAIEADIVKALGSDMRRVT